MSNMPPAEPKICQALAQTAAKVISSALNGVPPYEERHPIQTMIRRSVIQPDVAAKDKHLKSEMYIIFPNGLAIPARGAILGSFDDASCPYDKSIPIQDRRLATLEDNLNHPEEFISIAAMYEKFKNKKME